MHLLPQLHTHKHRQAFIRHINLLLPLLLLFSHTCLSQLCYRPPNLLPLMRDCKELTEAIAEASLIPSENLPFTWGRALPNEGDQRHLPKIYWLVGPGPKTCAAHLDALDSAPNAQSTFRLRSVGFVVEAVVSKCLARQRKVGRWNLLRGGVWVNIVRSDNPWGFEGQQGGVLMNGRNVTRLDLGNGTALMVGDGLEMAKGNLLAKPLVGETLKPLENETLENSEMAR